MGNPDVLEKAGKKVVLLGNEAIARGAIEAGVGFSACYPGTPSSEVGLTFADVAKKAGFYFEWSTNEKVAFEACAGAAFCGVRALTALKHFGLNVASDSVFPVAYVGVHGGLVINVADDPLGHSSGQSEEDMRRFARVGSIPLLEPSNTQECKELTKIAFEISEKYEVPVFVRTTTMVSHSAGTVKLGPIKKPKTKGRFVKDFERYFCVRPVIQKMHERVISNLDKIEKEYNRLNSVEGNRNSRVWILTSGVSYQYAKEINPKGVKLGKLTLTYPISRKFVSDFIKGLDTLIVLEELEPIVEDFVRGLAKDVNPKLKIYGKNILSRVGEYSTELIREKIAPILKIKKPEFMEHERKLKGLKLPTRKAVMCPGCPHRSTFYAVKKVLGENVVWGGDIGCYILGVLEPFRMQNFILAMGASVGVTHGIRKVSDQKAVAFIGDSTFFHAGMAGLANMKYNDPKVLVVVMDNGITAMTGHQPHPGTGFSAVGDQKKPIKIEDVVKSFGINNVRVVNAFNQKALQAAVKELDSKPGVSVLISRGMCRLMMKRIMRRKGQKFPVFEIDPDEKRSLGMMDKFAGPAIMKKGGKYYIRSDMCWGCSVCSQICPPGAIKPKAQKGG
ncbi:MAG: indolepyruvate ferredoxin oxidoreductase subunit alpha [Candidatus Aenigmatarchaeota archaeon]|nr:MAG: indolepyruvate ferredoxin oxidoreductase subunit alpha [Candidatus Aenigmarchaeota archaeon]